MRDNHEGLPEIINAYERDEHFFCSVSLTIRTETKVFEFGINQESYKAVKRILSLRPFAQFPGAKYRYFYAQGTKIRIEQEKQGKEFEVVAPESLLANLTWFFQVKDFKAVAYLPEITQER